MENNEFFKALNNKEETTRGEDEALKYNTQRALFSDCIMSVISANRTLPALLATI